MISEHSAHSTPQPFGIRTWLWRYTCLLLLISMLWHRQAIFESKGDKLSSSAESRIRTHQDLRHQIASRLNAHWQTDWAIEDQANKLELGSPSLWSVNIHTYVRTHARTHAHIHTYNCCLRKYSAYHLLCSTRLPSMSAVLLWSFKCRINLIPCSKYTLCLFAVMIQPTAPRFQCNRDCSFNCMFGITATNPYQCLALLALCEGNP